MSTELQRNNGAALAIEQVLVGGDLSKLSPAERVAYYNRVCESLGLNPFTRPFEYVRLNGKEQLYAKKDCTEQLRSLRKVSVKIVSRESVEGVYVVTAQATDAAGRVDESIGAVPIEGLKGESRANALMKAETKAKRRVTLSICGLGMLDEVEVDAVPGAQRIEVQPPAPKGSIAPATSTAQDAAPSPQLTVIAGNAAEKAPESRPEPAFEGAYTPPPEDRDPGADDDAEPGEVRDLVTWWKCHKEGSAKAHTLTVEWIEGGQEPRLSRGQLAKIHILKKSRGWDRREAEWDARLLRKFNKTSSGDLCGFEASIVIDALEKEEARWGTAEEKDARQARKAEEVQGEWQAQIAADEAALAEEAQR